MIDQEKLALVGAITKVRALAAVQFDNDIYENIYAIYSQLTLKEKKVFIKGMTEMSSMAEDPNLENKILAVEFKKFEHIPKSAIQDEIDEIEDYNKMELIKLKSWLVKATTVIVVSGFVLVIGFSIMFTGTDNVLLRSLGHVGDVLKAVVE